MVLSELAALVGASNFDGISAGLGLGTSGRGARVDQEFQKKFARIDYRIQQQQLHREDIRDLMELTVGRMDIYHVVGTLLLTFCMTWFSDNAIMDNDAVPEWFATLFLISNFCACGYLIFSVWLAMHASIASQSIGTRLLTSFARLSIPTVRELQEIQVPFFYPMVDKLLGVGRQLGAVRSKGGDKADVQEPEDTAVRPRPATGSWRFGSAPRQSPLHPVAELQPARSVAELATTAMGSAAEPPAGLSSFASSKAASPAHLGDIDRYEHFRRFLCEQRRWLSYDAYARVCMSLGMNQMLQALAYYIIGEVGRKSTAAAIFSFLGVKMLALQILRLDVRPGNEGCSQRFYVMTLHVLPSILASCVLYAPLSTVTRSLMATPSFLLHALWLVYIGSEINPSKGADSSAGVQLPMHLRTTYYLNVLTDEQRRAVDAVQASDRLNMMEDVRLAREELVALARAVMEEEACSGVVQPARRSDARVRESRNRLQRYVDRARERGASGDASVESEMKRAHAVLERFALWEKAPDILATLEALRSEAVQEWLEKDQRKAVEDAYQEFLRQCEELQLGISVPTSVGSADASLTGGSRRSDDNNAAPAASGGGPRSALNVAPGEERCVRVDAYRDSLAPDSVWIDTGKNELVPVPERRAGSGSFQRATSFRFLGDELSHWSSEAARLRDLEDLSDAHGSSERPPQAPRPHVSGATSAAAGARPQSEREGHEPSQDAAAFIPPNAMPPDALPAVVVHRFTLGCALWWFVAIFIHCFKPYTPWMFEQMTMNERSQSLQLQQVGATWPEPAALFEVVSLRCLPEAIVVEDRSVAYSAQRLDRLRLGELKELDDLDLASIHPCAGNADCLGSVGVSSVSSLRSLEIEVGAPAMDALFPGRQAWRASSVARGNCPTASQCSEMWIASSDGTSVEVSRLVRANRSGQRASWRLRRRFALGTTAGLASDCGPEPTGIMAFAGRTLNYSTVRALQVSEGGTTLAVLSAQCILEVWDIRAGCRLSHRRLGPAGDATCTAMCHDGADLLLARRAAGAAGAAALLVAPLPPELLLPPPPPPTHAEQGGQAGSGSGGFLARTEA
eukprot:TRINITY_DN23209_c0_g1_i1.p1 TRINITY_DN23209_c0_g1~~TRINITY_DN23209_c0_g1_i1.p1  ORF type:complete len:1082 (-),score=218.88 TRINITY_DN23209_c0_g1_i1:23-3268(-)